LLVVAEKLLALFLEVFDLGLDVGEEVLERHG
jgi:hypothetical protein